MEFKDELRTARIKRGYTMTDLAGLIGVSTQAISNWESGRTAIASTKKIRLLRVLPELGGSDDAWIQSAIENAPDTRHEDAPIVRNPESISPIARAMIERDIYKKICEELLEVLKGGRA